MIIQRPSDRVLMIPGIGVQVMTPRGGAATYNSLTYNGTTTTCVVTDAAALQNLHTGAMCVEAWIRADGWGEGDTSRIFDKAGALSEGWVLYLHNARGIAAVVYAPTRADSRSGTDDFTPDSNYYHVCMQYDDAGDRKIYFWVSGVAVSSYDLQNAAVGAVVSDVGNNLYLGARSDGGGTCDGRLGGWARISKVLRYTNGVGFTPNDRFTPPAVDANTVWQTDYSEGTGNVLGDDSGNGNHGALSNHTWNVETE